MEEIDNPDSGVGSSLVAEEEIPRMPKPAQVLFLRRKVI